MSATLLTEIEKPREAIQVLLVEDNPQDALLVREALLECQDLACTVSHRRSYQESKKLLDAQPFGVVILDLTLPDADGLNTVLRMKADAPDLPIIVLTGLDDMNLALQSVASGAQDYLIKGEFDGELLGRAIRYAVERHRLKRELNQVHEKLKLAFRDLEAAAQTDPVTGLLNRWGMQEALNQYSSQNKSVDHGHLIAVLLDLDDFQKINEAYGFSVGDAVIRDVGKRIVSCLRPQDLAACVGGTIPHPAAVRPGRGRKATRGKDTAGDIYFTGDSGQPDRGIDGEPGAGRHPRSGTPGGRNFVDGPPRFTQKQNEREKPDVYGMGGLSGRRWDLPSLRFRLYPAKRRAPFRQGQAHDPPGRRNWRGVGIFRANEHFIL